MTQTASKSFGKIRTVLWPIQASELSRFLPMLVMYALIVFNYSLLKPAKDALVITGASGASALPFIKLWAILPMALFFAFLFTRLSNKIGRDRVFYTMMSIFLAFFVLFGFVLYPLQDVLHPHAFADKVESMLPGGFHGLITLFRNWTFTLFYVMAELWGTVIMSVLFWGFANDITTVSQAKRYYAILGLGANLATVGAGEAAIYLSSHYLHLPFLTTFDTWGKTLFSTTILVTISGTMTMLLYRWLDLRLSRQHKESPQGQTPQGSSSLSDKSKIKLSMRENFAYLMKSRYLLCIAVIVFTYNVALNMVEVVWKDSVYALYPDRSDLGAYMGGVYKWMGLTSTFFAIFFCGQSIRRWGWTVGAMITPVALFISTAFFFFFLLAPRFGLEHMTAWMGIAPLAVGVFFGSVQNILCRACKFTFFDTTKEIAFIPLSPECKLKGKAAIDGVGSRLGKSGGSFIHQCLLLCFGSVAASTPFVGAILLCVIGTWMAAVKNLGKEFEALTGETAGIPKTAPKQEAKTSAGAA